MPASSTARLQGRRFATELFGFDETSAAYIQARFEAIMKALDEVDRRHGFPSDELNR